MPIDSVNKRVGDSGLSGNLPMDNPVIADALRKANVQDAHKILTEYGVITNVDLEKFLSQRHSELMNVHIQPDPIYANYASASPPPMEAFLMHDTSAALTRDDIQIANDGFSRAISIGKSEGSSGAKGQGLDKQEVQQTIDDWTNFYDTVEQKLLEGQLLAGAKVKQQELEDELQRLITMARNGQIDDPCLLIVVMTKVSTGQLGIQSMKESLSLNREMKQQNKFVENLKNSGSDVKSYYTAKQGLDESKVNYNQILGRYTDIAKQITERFTTADSMIKSINSTRAEIIRRIGGQ